MESRDLLRWFSYSVAAAFSAYLSYTAFSVRQIANPQISVKRELLTPIVKVGEPARIKVTVDRTRACPTLVHTWFVADSGDVVIDRITPSPFSSLVGKGISQVIDTSTQGAGPGEYTIMADGVIDCGANGSFVSPNPPLRITIVKDDRP